MLLAFGCSLIQNNDDSSTVAERLERLFGEQAEVAGVASEGEEKIANPPAKTIRFDGREVVLGINDVTQINAEHFADRLSHLLSEERFLTAKSFVARHADIGEQFLWESWATEADAESTVFIASVLSKNVDKRASWNAMLAYAKQDPVAARNYQRARLNFIENLRTGDPTNEVVEPLRTTSRGCKQPLVFIDTLQLLAVVELISKRNAWAESLLLQAIELAEKHDDHLRAANLWLMISMRSGHAGENQSTATVAWRNAVSRQSTSLLYSGHPLNISFWVRAERQRPSEAAWPELAQNALLPVARPVGCKLTKRSSTELVVWSAIGNAQLDGGEPQLALVNFKKAEDFATGDDVLWLRIAQATCLATLGQYRAAAALLSEPLASDQPVIASAANAALGSAKLQAGTFQQGAQLLNKALSASPHLNWPNRSKAEADLALAMLVIGETEKGLKSLHGVQRKFESEGNWFSLLQSLENELRLLQHEGKKEAAKEVRSRILRVEKLASHEAGPSRQRGWR